MSNRGTFNFICEAPRGFINMRVYPIFKVTWTTWTNSDNIMQLKYMNRNSIKIYDTCYDALTVCYTLPNDLD